MESSLQFLRYLLIALGACLVTVGGGLLLWFGQLVYQLVAEPEQVRIIQFILDQIAIDAPVITGSSSGSEFELTLSKPAKTFAFFFLGVFALGILAGVVKTLVSGGIEIIKGVLTLPKVLGGNKDSQSNQRIYPRRRS